jgi:NAD(P)-dependent dehydrogenase (short-subunit alcohol dehydrogenase family)
MSNAPFIDFQGKYVVVSGATSGIGRAICIQLKNMQAKPVLVGRDIEKLRRMGSELDIKEDCLLCIDLYDHKSVQPRLIELSKKVGRIYGFCHSAGTIETRPLKTCSSDSITKMMDLNLTAGIEMARTLCRRDVMEEAGGSVLFISSISGLIGTPGQIAYSASKGAVIAAARTMAIELARRNIRVNTLSPGLVRTPMADKAFSVFSEQQRKDIEDAHPLGPGTPEDVARAAVFLMAPQNAWITGINMVIDGGYTAR